MKIKYSFIFLFLFTFIFILTGCDKKTEETKEEIEEEIKYDYIAVENDTGMADIDKLPANYKNYEIKPFGKDDLIAIEEITAEGFEDLQIGDVLVYKFELKNIYYGRVVFVDYDKYECALGCYVEWDSAVAEYGFLKPKDSAKAAELLVLGLSGAYYYIPKEKVNYIVGKVIKVKYANENK